MGGLGGKGALMEDKRDSLLVEELCAFVFVSVCVRQKETENLKGLLK